MIVKNLVLCPHIFIVRSVYLAVALTVLFSPSCTSQSAQEPTGKPIVETLRCSDPDSRDQDDMCLWIHLTEPAQSTIIASDKEANKLFIYDLEGRTIQVIPAKHPGNIDARYDFPLGKENVDIIAFNQRDDPRILVYKVVVSTRHLERVDNDAITTGENYGGTLYHSPKTGKYYFVATSESGQVEQYELSDDGKGKVQGKKVRSWKIGKCEAAVADDQTGKIYIGEENKGVWEIGGEPEDAAPGKLVIKLGDNGLNGDVEGLAIYHLPEEIGYLIVSNQSRSNFKVYRREGEHIFVGTFAVEGAKETDGVDVINVNLGSRFSLGLFACHSAEGSSCPVLITTWESVAKAFQPELKISTEWNPRK